MIEQYKKNLLLHFENHTCEICKKVFEPSYLEIHRIKRGNQGGEYTLRNCMVVCKGCHKLLHYKEFK